MIRAGQLRQSVEFKTKLATEKNEFGESEPTFISDFNVRCEVVNVQRTNSILAAGIEKESNISIKLRYNRNITPDHFFVVQGVTYEIRSFENVRNLNKELQIDGIAFV
jgi:SPP1 family predicted phage head-tail adaptor